jgi:hypothetical protein
MSNYETFLAVLTRSNHKLPDLAKKRARLVQGASKSFRLHRKHLVQVKFSELR